MERDQGYGELDATALLVSLVGELSEPVSDMLQQLAARYPDLPRIGLSELSATAMRAVVRARMHEVVFIDRLESDLPDVLLRVSSQRRSELTLDSVPGRRALCETLCEDLTFSPFIRHLMFVVLHADPPFRRVEDAVSSMRHPRSTVLYHWSQQIAVRGGPTLHGFLRWVLLLHVAERSSSARSLAKVCAELNVDARTIRLAARRLLGERPLRDARDSSFVAERLYAALRNCGRSTRAYYLSTGPE